MRLTIRLLLAHKARHAAAIRQIDKEVQRLTLLDKKKTGRTLRLKGANITAPKKKNVKKRSTKKVVAKPTTVPTVAEISYAVLSRKATPMHIGELAEKVAKRKGRTYDPIFAQNLGAIMMRDDRFVRVGRGMYAVK